MYTFTISDVGGFRIAKSFQRKDDEHRKRFTEPGVTPMSQETWNLYISGSFSFSGGDFTQILNAGNTSFDLLIPEFTADQVYVERVLSASATRYCVSALGARPWIRDVRDLSLNQEYQPAGEGAIVVLAGSVNVDGLVLRSGAIREVSHGSVINSVGLSKIAIALNAT